MKEGWTMKREIAVACTRLGVALIAGLLTVACTTEQTTTTPRITEKTFPLKPVSVPVRVGVLSGELGELSVMERVNASTGEVVYAPQLHGTLKLKNTSSDEAVSLVSGQVEYLDSSGTRIPLAEGRGDTTLRIYSYAGDRLDPGKEANQTVDVPFPASALQANRLAEIRLSLTYLPTPYERKSVEVPVAVGEPS
jgi:hypothetical protein